jgi:hypothetical protein
MLMEPQQQQVKHGSLFFTPVRVIDVGAVGPSGLAMDFIFIFTYIE